MNKYRFVEAMKKKPELSAATRKNIIRRSLERCSWKTKCTITMEELSELSQSVSKHIRGCGDRMNLLEEMADVYICMKYLEEIFKLSPEEIQTAIDVKLIRDRERMNRYE